MMLQPRQVALEQWVAEAAALHASGYTRFVLLDAFDDVDRAPVLRLTLVVANADAQQAVLATTIDRDDVVLPSLASLWRAARWSEEHIVAAFSPRSSDDCRAPVNLRKDALLPARQEIPWPGAAEESGRARRKQSAPGVGDPKAVTPQEIVASAYGGRRR